MLEVAVLVVIVCGIWAVNLLREIGQDVKAIRKWCEGTTERTSQLYDAQKR
jgi:hypothetical protein